VSCILLVTLQNGVSLDISPHNKSFQRTFDIDLLSLPLQSAAVKHRLIPTLDESEMNIHLIITFVLASAAILNVGCTSFEQKNLSESQSPYSGSGNGVIVGSVTAPFAQHYHESVLFGYRKLGSGDKTAGILTSGIRHKNFLLQIPSCSEGGIPEQCGRVFAISLPAGDYEIYKAQVIGRGDFQQVTSALFTVTKGDVIYIGNLHVTFCVGMVNRYRGNILGADVSLRDEYERDIAVIREQHGELATASIDKRLLPDNSWRWRVSWNALFRGDVGPYDWGDCSK